MDTGLEWAHIDGRDDMRLRYSENNCLVLCRQHHQFFHSSSEDYNGRALMLQMVQEFYPEQYEALLVERSEMHLINIPRINEQFYRDKIKELQLKIKQSKCK